MIFSQITLRRIWRYVLILWRRYFISLQEKD